MGKYSVALSPKAKEDLKAIYKSGNKGAIKKIESLLSELEEHPTTVQESPSN